MLQSVVAHFNLAYFVGFGSGAGSNVLCRYALKHPDKVLSLFLINPNANTDNTYYNWLFANNNAEWQRICWSGIGFGHNSSDCYDSVEACKQQLLSMCLPNVAGYIKAYNDRPDLGIQRDLAKQPGSGAENFGGAASLQHPACQAFLVTGGLAKDMVTRLVAMNSRCDPGRTEFLIVDESDGMMMETEPAKLAVLFLRHLRPASRSQHPLDSTLSPTQSAPPFIGAGLSHRRLRRVQPPGPQVTLQGDQFDQAEKPPVAANRILGDAPVDAGVGDRVGTDQEQLQLPPRLCTSRRRWQRSTVLQPVDSRSRTANRTSGTAQAQRLSGRSRKFGRAGVVVEKSRSAVRWRRNRRFGATAAARVSSDAGVAACVCG
uniref:Tubulin domain-containing protein n=1 Tax=Macrostomum lignano TaxID=282301 RepID=A0A1I8IUM3_9PLAT